MNFRKLKIFFETAKCLNMTKVAKSMYISQPSISQAIAELESDLDVKLFDRIGKRLYLTHEGEVYFEYSRRILNLYEEANSTIRSSKEGQKGKIVIGASTTIGIYILPELIKEFNELHKNIEISLIIENTQLIGADDYVTKPFNHLELVARVKSQLRRYDYPLNRENTQDLIVIKDLTIDTVNKQVSLRGENIKLTATEYKILTLLASHPGRIFSIKEIYERVWEEPFYKSENTVTVHIRRMREKIEINSKEPEYIKVVWGLGYKIDK
ncbi:winged helix-turn-helix domain-containing protein [Streptomyces flavofungini]|uniref:winged helix-turn-helix domain-containing protein n=1 Tax=Streptomyces flavofungini TaxID=68200 RepID=UPI0025AFF09E|nr:winged helix-turn-helix domain-containing protein [Streptomyces flavofungini]WJV51865.1 winged helix-turn-helix domain-containing protein [Streptomyces flavofungini]